MPKPTERERISRLLIVEDDVSQLRTLKGIMAEEGFDVIGCATATEALAHVREEDFGVAVVDLRLPDLSGTELLERIQALNGRIRVIINTAYGSFDSAKDAVNLGAFAYVEKAGDPHELVRQVHRAFHYHLDQYAQDLEAAVAERTKDLRAEISERERAEEALQQSELRLRSIVDSEPECVKTISVDGRLLDMNRAGLAMIEADSLEQVCGRDMCDFIVPECHRAFRRLHERVLDGESETLEFETVGLKGTHRWMETHAVPLRDVKGAVTAQLAVTRDVTERRLADEVRRRLEEQLRHAQKMEAVGTLAAGVAHDFNNLLTAIVGYTDLARRKLPEDSAAQQALEGIDQVADQATGVTGALLAFSRTAESNRSPLALGLLVTDAVRMLRRMLPAAVEIATDVPPAGGPWVEGDATQLQQVVLNLAINARDAMPEGGRLSIAVRTEVVDPPSVWSAVVAGHQAAAVLVVEDTGTGMTEEVRQQVFDPFYTTKPRERGTGLGLSMIHGIVGDHGGRIDIESAPASGTRVTICLPSCPPSEAAEYPVADAQVSDAHGQVIILAEDNQYVRTIMASVLAAEGYEVVQAADGVEAMVAFAARQDAMRLAILDLDLPGKNGLACLREMHEVAADLPIILVTGNPQSDLDDDIEAVVLRKPFKMADLTQLVARMLRASANVENVV